MLYLLLFIFMPIYSQTIIQLNETSIKEELPIGTIVTFLTDKIPHIDQSSEYDLVQAISPNLDLFSIDHNRHTLVVKKRIDFEQLCIKQDFNRCLIQISIAVSAQDTINVYTLPIQIKNIDDNPIKFTVNRTIIEIDENDENWSHKTYRLPQAFDADGDLITYSLYLQNWNKPIGLFELDNEKLLLKPLRKFDREEQSLYLLRLVAENQYQKDVSIDIIVIIKDVNDNPPQCQYNQSIVSINNIDSSLVSIVNATDFDEHDNGKLEYNLIYPSFGFNIDNLNGQIRFNYTQWLNKKQTKIFVNVTDFGNPIRLSSICAIEFQFGFLYSIDLKLNNEKNQFLLIENLHSPIGHFNIINTQDQKSCLNCSIRIKSSLENFFEFNQTTFDLHFNLNSIVLKRILLNKLIKIENFSINLTIDVYDLNNPLIQRNKNYSLNLYFNKEKLLKNSNIIFLKLNQHSLLNEKISLINYLQSCLNPNYTKEFLLYDPTETFDIDQNYNLIIKKHLKENYELIIKEIRNNQTNKLNLCSFQLRINVYNPYSSTNVYPYFSQSFYIISSSNLSRFVLPLLPSYVKYVSSKPNEVFVNEKNASITVQSSSLFSSYYYDFHIEAIDSQIPSLTCSVPVRIYFGINQQAPRLLNNFTRELIEILPSGFNYQIKAYDPDISLNDQTHSFPPTIEYDIESIENIDIERYTGRIFLRNSSQSLFNFTVTLTDFGQPNRLMTKQRITFDLRSDEKILPREISMMDSITFIVLSACVISMIIILIIITLLCNYCYCNTSIKKPTANLSPTTPNSCLIDNEFITATSSSLPRVINREQRIYPNDYQRKFLEQIQLPPPKPYTNEDVSIKQDYQRNLSINDINKYLERFEKIYNNSSEIHLGEPVGSVV